MTLLRLSFACFVLAAIGLLFIPLAIAKILAGVCALLFIVFLFLGLAQVDRIAA